MTPSEHVATENIRPHVAALSSYTLKFRTKYPDPHSRNFLGKS